MKYQYGRRWTPVRGSVKDVTEDKVWDINNGGLDGARAFNMSDFRSYVTG